MEEKNRQKFFGKKVMLIVTILILVIGGGIYSWSAASSEPKKQVTAKSLKEINEEIDKAKAVLLSGKVEPKLVSKVFLNQERGKVASLDVNEGDTVKKGQKLFSYTNPEGDLAMKEAELAVRTEASTLEQKRTELNQKYTQIQEKKNKLQKVNNQIRTADVETKSALESDKATFEEAVNQLQSEINNLVNEIQSAELSVEKAQASYELSKQKYENKDVLSDIDGIIKKIDRDQIEKSVGPNGSTAPFIETYDTSEFYVSGKVTEFQKEKLQTMPNATFTDRNNEERQWTGKFEKIDDVGDANENDGGNDTMTKYKYRAKVDPSEQPPTIGKHVFVAAHEEKNEELLLPKEAVIEENGQYYVWKVNGKKIKKTKIEIEKKDKDYLVVKNGLTLEDKVTFPFQGLKEGMEVGQYFKS